MSKVKEIKERTELTERQHEIFDWICQFRIENDYPPSIREIGKQFNFSEKAAFDHVNTLRKKGWIVTEPERPEGVSEYFSLPHFFMGLLGSCRYKLLPKGRSNLQPCRIEIVQGCSVEIRRKGERVSQMKAWLERLGG